MNFHLLIICLMSILQILHRPSKTLAFTTSTPTFALQRRYKRNSFLHSTPPGSEDSVDDENFQLSNAQQEWLQQQSENSSNANFSSVSFNANNNKEGDHDDAEIGGNVNIPKTGISVDDEMVASQSEEKFLTFFTPLINIPTPNSVAQIETFTSGTIGSHPQRYIVALDDYNDNENESFGRQFAMIDVPPFSQELVDEIQSFINGKSKTNDGTDENNTNKDAGNNNHGGVLSHILVTSRDTIHYDESPAVYVTRKSDLQKWKKVFPQVKIVTYRMDTPRDCKEAVTQVLDGYGPWALTESDDDDDDDGLLVESGRPLTQMEWDEDIQVKVLDEGEVPPDDNDEESDKDEKYTPEAIRNREEGKKILAVYTPGHSFGSMTYIFPKTKVCCSGYTIPVEDKERQANANAAGMAEAGPALDYTGYLTTNKGGIDRQLESARLIVDNYGDRFEAVLASRGEPVWLSNYEVKERARIWNGVLKDFAELGSIYEQLGIIS